LLLYLAKSKRGWSLVPELNKKEVEISLIRFAEKESYTFHRRLVKGPPPVYRWVAWKVALKLKQQYIPGLYQELKKNTNNKCFTVIQSDLDRTFPMHPLFGDSRYSSTSQEALKNILVAFAAYSPGVGYCQGMNFVAGFLLIISGFKEEESFWAFLSIMTRKREEDMLKMEGIEGFYTENFPLLKVMNKIFMQLLEKITPTVKEHIESTELSEELWLNKWFSMLFLHNLPMSHCIRVWDYFIIHGTSGLLKVTIAILKYISKKLLQLDFADSFALLKNLNNELPSPNKLILNAEKISIDWTQFNANEFLFTKNAIEDIHKERKNYDDHERKSEMIELPPIRRCRKEFLVDESVGKNGFFIDWGHSSTAKHSFEYTDQKKLRRTGVKCRKSSICFKEELRSVTFSECYSIKLDPIVASKELSNE